MHDALNGWGCDVSGRGGSWFPATPSTGRFPDKSQSQGSGSHRGRGDPTFELGLGAEAYLEIGKWKSRGAAKGQPWRRATGDEDEA